MEGGQRGHAGQVAGTTARSSLLRSDMSWRHRLSLPSRVVDAIRRAPAAGRLAGHGGLTLIELLVSLSLSVVLAGIAAPLIPAHYRQFQLSSAARLLATDVMRVRMKAIGENTQHRLIFTSQSYQVQAGSGTGFINDGVAVSLPRGTYFQAAPGALTFSPLGLLLPPATLSVTVGNGVSTKIVSVSEIGRVTVQ